MHRIDGASEVHAPALLDNARRLASTHDADGTGLEQAAEVHGYECWRSLCGLSAKRAQERARDDVPLDLTGPVPDTLDPGIAPESLYGQVVHQSHTAKDLHRFIGDAGQHLRREELGLGNLAIGLEFLVEAPGGGERQPVGGVNPVIMSASLKETPWNLPMG